VRIVGASLVVLATLVLGPAAVASPSRAGVPIPVVACAARSGVGATSQPPIPAQLSAAVTTRTAARLRFYSDGYVVVLAPSGWTCTGLEAADGGQSLSVFPTGESDPLAVAAVVAEAGVTARFDYTGHGPGAALVCGLFPASAAARFADQTGGCTKVPAREVIRHPSRDVATFLDPPGVTGSGEPSGGTNPASGAVLFPQLTPEPGSVNVAKITCAAAKPLAALCPAILNDFVTRAPARPRT